MALDELELKELPPERNSHSMVRDPENGLVYVYGGANSNGPLGDLWTFDCTAGPQEAAWNQLHPRGEKPGALEMHTCHLRVHGEGEARRKELLVVGGKGLDGISNRVYALDLGGNEWRVEATLPSELCS